MKVLLLIGESFLFALGALKANLLRTTLSLLGVSVGIFAIVAVFTLVDSVELNIRQSMNFIGDKVIYIQKWPWIFQKNYPWYKYINRPVATVSEFKILEKELKNSTAIAIYCQRGGQTLSRLNNSIKNVNLQGVSFNFREVSDVRLASGRYFTQEEVESQRHYAIIGYDIAEELFPEGAPLGKTFKIKGKELTVVGVFEKQGKNLIGLPSNDETCLVPFGVFNKFYNVKRGGLEPVIAIKGEDDDEGLMWLESEVRGMMRGIRGLKPAQEDNFAINRPEMIASTITAIFSVISLAGAVIGSFSILVGGFGIANIMFVSVKERTHIIGIQKSLGAKNYFILLQFLFEAIMLSIVGGIAGIALVFLLTVIPQDTLPIVMTTGNLLTGVVISIIIGMVAGIVPAISASRLDPVIAIRSKG
jgi:putative ABC transport system permease protein